jgi:probable LLM family oxidoreductase
MELGAYSFGDTQRNPNGTLRSTAEAIRNLFEAIVAADQVGLDYFGVGEHHTLDMPASSPGAVIAAAAGATKQITLGSSVSVLSTDDPVRVFQQFATADGISGGRVEITAGRGSSAESFPLFGYDLKDYDRLYAEKLDLLLKINGSVTVNWSGTVRPSIPGMVVVPRPTKGRLPIWLGTGGSPPSSIRAGELGLPVAYGIIGGEPARFAPLADLYRRAAAAAGHGPANIKVAVAAFGLIAPTKREAIDRFYPGWHNLNIEMGRLRGWPPPDKRAFDRQAKAPGAYYVGAPDEIAARIVDLHKHLGHTRHCLQMDLGGLPPKYFLDSINLLATEVKPRVERLLAAK